MQSWSEGSGLSASLDTAPRAPSSALRYWGFHSVAGGLLAAAAALEAALRRRVWASGAWRGRWAVRRVPEEEATALI